MAQARPTPDDIGKATVFAQTRRKATTATKSWVVVTELGQHMAEIGVLACLKTLRHGRARVGGVFVVMLVA
ncbi:unnamed protein product [Rhodiola kirilowii]